MATSMTLGVSGMNLNLGTNSPMVGGGQSHGGNGSIGNLTPSHNGIKYGGNGGGSGASSVPSPASSVSSTPSSTITINAPNSESMGTGPGSVNSNNNSNGSLGINTSNGDAFGSKCKRKINFSNLGNLGIPARGHQPATVARRNARERNRVKQVNNGFAALKQHIPLGHRSKKMSKVETLRCAVDYIKNLKGLLTIHNTFNSTSPMGSSISNNSDDGMMEDENQEQETLQAHQQHQMNSVNNQQEAYALSSSSTSSSPTLSDFGAAVAHLPHLTALHALHPQQHLGNNNTNQLRHLSLSHHQMHGTNSVSVAAALLVESNNNAMTPNSNQLSPTSSDDPSSPYTSEASYVNSNGNMKGNVMYDYENYEPASPEDDELLDAIAFWQQS